MDSDTYVPMLCTVSVEAIILSMSVLEFEDF